MIHYLFLIITFLVRSNIFIRGIIIQEDAKEIYHGILQSDTYEKGEKEEVKDYKYYINITDYELNEENILEFYSKENMHIIYDVYFYMLLTDKSIDDIKTITPNKSEDQYDISTDSSKTDPLTYLNYLFIPFKKTSINQTYLIILISTKNLDKTSVVYYSISNRIKSYKLVKENNTMELDSRNDIHLYYKFEIDKNFNLTENSILFLVKNDSIPLFSTNLTSLKTYENDIFVVEKNKNESLQITEIYLGIKTENAKPINIVFYLDNNDIYYINDKERVSQKLYFEKINCNKQLNIIENYVDFSKKMQRFLTIKKFYGDYTLTFYNTINDIISNVYNSSEESKGIEIKDKIISVEGRIGFYVLKCTTPTAFNFEYFENDTIPITLKEGFHYKTFLTQKKIEQFNIYIGDYYKKYKLQVSLLEIDDMSKRFDYTLTLNKNNKEEIKTITLNKAIMSNNETLFYGFIKNPIVQFKSSGFFISYYLSSNRLFYNIIEGETIINKKGMENLSFKIKRDLLFDYITFEAKSDKILECKYELIIINKEEMEDKKIIAPLPQIILPSGNKIKFQISNPYNKYYSVIKDNDNDNNYYLIISFVELDSYCQIYVNIKYNYNKQIQLLEQMKSKIILPEEIYEIYGDKNYLTKSKIVFNINRCDNSKKYLFINYYENNNNIINQNNITKIRENIINNNSFYNTKIKILDEGNNSNSNSINNYNKINDTRIKSLVPADYYNKGDIIFNYFLINEHTYSNIEITNNFTINYEDIMKLKTKLYWNRYITNKNQIDNENIPIKYSIYILPKDSIVDSMCQLSFIPSNYSVMNMTETEIDINKGNYKVIIIASVLDKEFPITNIYDVLYLEVGIRINIVLVIILSLLGLITIIVVLCILLRKKRKFICFKRKESVFSYKIESTKTESNIDEEKIDDDINNNNNGDLDNQNDEKTNDENIEKKEDNDLLNELNDQLIDNN